MDNIILQQYMYISKLFRKLRPFRYTTNMTERDTPALETEITSELDTYLEKHGHLKGARVLCELAESFGVQFDDVERHAIAVKVAIDRGVETAVFASQDYGRVHNAIAKGVPFEGYWPQVLATEFHTLMNQLDFDRLAHMTRLPEGYHRQKISNLNMESNDRSTPENLFSYRMDALRTLAEHRARFMALDVPVAAEASGVDTGMSDSDARHRFNQFLKTFYLTYEELGSMRKSKHLLPSQYVDDGRLAEWRSLERRELIRTLKELRIASEPETLATLAWRGMGRVRTSLLRRQDMTNPA